MENSIEVFQTFKTELSYDLASPLLYIYLNEITMSKTYLHPQIRFHIIYNNWDMETN